MSAVINDTYTSAGTVNLTSHSPDTNLSGNAYVDFNQIPALHIVGGSGFASAVSTLAGPLVQGDVITSTIRDGQFQIDVHVPDHVAAGTYNMAAGLIFRLSTGSGGGNLYLVKIGNDTNVAAGYYVKLIRFDAGVATVLQTIASGQSYNNSTHTVGVTCRKGTLTASLDGVAAANVTDTTYQTASAAGPWVAYGSGYPNVNLKNFQANTIAIVIDQTTLPSGQTGTAYSQPITATGGYSGTNPTTYTWTISAGALPPGLSISGSTGTISGTPATGGTYFFTVTATDTLGNTGSQAFSLLIKAGVSTLFLLHPDPKQTDDTRRFQQNVANILNGLMYSGAIVATGQGAFAMGSSQLIVGDDSALPSSDNGSSITSLAPVAKPSAGGILYVSPTNKLANTTPTEANYSGGVLSVGSDVGGTGEVLTGLISCNQLTAITSVTVQNGGFISLQVSFGEVGFFQGFVDGGLVNAAGYILWQNDKASSNFPAHVFIIGNFTNYTGAATVGIMAAAGSIGGNATGAASYYLVGLSSSGGTPYNFSFDASGNLAAGSGQFKSTSANALAVGRQGTTNPAIQVDASAANCVTGLQIQAAATGAGVFLNVISSAATEGLTIHSKGNGFLSASSGTGTMTLGCGNFQLNGNGTTRINAASTITLLAPTSMVGTTTNDNASAGYVGEFLSSYLASGSAIALSNATPANITSISLTKGDWDVEGNVNFSPAAATFTGFEAGLSSTSATLPTDGSECYSGLQGTLLTDTDTITLPRKRFSLAATTTIYLVGQAAFSAGSVGGFGGITARRVR